jgi:hypothetical protein
MSHPVRYLVSIPNELFHFPCIDGLMLRKCGCAAYNFRSGFAFQTTSYKRYNEKFQYGKKIIYVLHVFALPLYEDVVS